MKRIIVLLLNYIQSLANTYGDDEKYDYSWLERLRLEFRSEK